METFKLPFYYTDGILLFIGTIENSHKNSTRTASDPATSLDMQSVSNKTHPYRDLALWLVLSWGTWAGLSLSRHKKILIIITSVIISTPASPLPCYQKEEEPCADGTVGLHEQDGAVCVYCICPGNQTATSARASWEGPSGAKREIQGNVPLLKQLQQLLQVLPYAHMQAPLLPVHHTHPLCLKHSCTTRLQSSFQLKTMQDPQPFSYQPTIPPWCVCPPHHYPSQ